MTRTLQKSKNRRESGAFAALPMTVLNHPNFLALSGSAVKLLLDLLTQLRFRSGGSINNGDLQATFSHMKRERGWKSKETLLNARRELEHYGFILLTRPGERMRKDRPNLYAITFFAIDECKGKLDIKATKIAPNYWKDEKTKFIRPPKRKKPRKPNLHIAPILRYENRGG